MGTISDFASDEPKKTEPDFKAEEPSKAPEAPPPEPVSGGIKINSSPQAPSDAPDVEKITEGILGKIADIGENAYLKLLVLGEPGSTKSSFVATAINNLVVDFEEGLISAKFAPHGIGEGTQGFPYENFGEFVNLIKLVKDRHPRLEKYEVFSVDTLSDLHKRGLAEITEREWRKTPSNNRYVPEVEHHQENNEKILRLIRILRDLDRHLIITSHSKTVEPKNKPAKTYADFSESLSNKIMGMMDIVGYMSMKKVGDEMKPVMRVVTDGTISCKTRIPLPAEIIDPTFPQILKAWNKAMNGA